MTDEPEVRHMFIGPPRYRAFLLFVGIAMAVLLVLGATVFDLSTNWAHRLCPLVGALSSAIFACLVAVDIYRPQALTRRRRAMVSTALMAMPAIAVTFALIGFFL